MQKMLFWKFFVCMHGRQRGRGEQEGFGVCVGAGGTSLTHTEKTQQLLSGYVILPQIALIIKFSNMTQAKNFSVTGF